MTLDDLEAAAEAGRVRTIRGLSERTEEMILEGDRPARAEPAARMLLHQAEREIDGARRAPRPPSRACGRSSPPARSGGRRRRSATSTCSPRRPIPTALMARFIGLGAVDARHRPRRPQVGRPAAARPAGRPDGRCRRATAGTYLIHFTGSKEHNVRLRARARDRGWSLSEYGFQRIGEDGEPLTGAGRGAPDVRDRGRGLRLPRPAVHRARAARGRGRDRGRPGRPAARAHHPGRPPRRLPHPQRLERRQPADRGDGRGRPAARLRLPGPDRPQPVARDRERADARPGRGGAGDHRRAERPVRGGGGRRHRAARDAEGGLPPAPRLRARGPRRRRRSTTTTSSSPASTSSSPPSTCRVASRGPS